MFVVRKYLYLSILLAAALHIIILFVLSAYCPQTTWLRNINKNVAGPPNIALAVRIEPWAEDTQEIKQQSPATSEVKSDRQLMNLGVAEEVKKNDDHLPIFLSANVVDYPAESVNQIDLNVALEDVPISPIRAKFSIFIDENGIVQELRWKQMVPPRAVRDRIANYILQQPFHPARKDGRSVKSRLVYELNIGSSIMLPKP